MIPIKYNLRNLVVRKQITLAAGFGVALVVFALASSLMLANGLEKTLERSTGPDVAIVLRKGADGEMPSAIELRQVGLVIGQAKQIGAAKEPPGVGELVMVLPLEKIGVDGVANVTVRGVQSDSLAFRPAAKVVEGRAPNPGTDEVIIGRAIRGRFKGLDLGGGFEVKRNRPLKIVGVFADEGSSTESEIWADLRLVGEAFGREGFVSSVRVRLDSPSKFEAFKALVESDRRAALVAQREQEFLAKQSMMTAFMLKLLGGLIAMFFGLGAVIGAAVTMNAQVAGRSKEIGTLRALGFSRGSVLLSFLFEAVLLAAGGGLVGALASLSLKAVKISMVNANTFSTLAFGFEPTAGIVITSVIVATVMGLFGGFLPAIRAARVSPVEAMRT